MPRKSLPEPSRDLVEVQTKQIGDLSERLGILNEVVAKRQDEADALQHQLIQTTAKIHADEYQWQQRQKTEALAQQAKMAKELEDIAGRQNQVNQLQRANQQTLERVTMLEQEVKHRLYDLSIKSEQYARLAQDRLDLERLTHEVEAKMSEAQTLWSQAQHKANVATEATVQARQALDECERRNQTMSQWDARLTALEKDLTIRQRHYEQLKDEVQVQLAKLEQAKRDATAVEVSVTV